MLREELLQAGLELHADKTKILTNKNPENVRLVVIGNFIQVLHQDDSHRYLGRLISLQPSGRVEVEFKNRLAAAWGKFHQHKNWMTNKDIALYYRLRMFNAIVTPTIIYALIVLPLGRHDLQKLDIERRKMLRLVVGWQRIPDEPWEDTMRRMTMRINHALTIFPIMIPNGCVFRNQWRIVKHVTGKKESH